MNLAAMVDEIGRAVSASVSRSLAPISRQVDELMAWRKSVGELRDGKDGAKGEPGEAGKDAPTVDISDIVLKVRALIPDPKDGRDGQDGRDGADAAPINMAAVVQSVLKEIPVPKPGEKGERGEQGERGEPAAISVGQGPPLTAGKAGDVYIDTVSGDVYRVKDCQ